MLGRSLPNWMLQPGPVLLRRFVQTKNQPLVDIVELIEANPNFAIVKFPDCRESTVSITELFPSPTREMQANEINPYVPYPTSKADTSEIDPYAVPRPQSTSNAPFNESQSSELPEERSQQSRPTNSQNKNRSDLRRSTRTRKSLDKFSLYFKLINFVFLIYVLFFNRRKIIVI